MLQEWKRKVFTSVIFVTSKKFSLHWNFPAGMFDIKKALKNVIILWVFFPMLWWVFDKFSMSSNNFQLQINIQISRYVQHQNFNTFSMFFWCWKSIEKQASKYSDVFLCFLMLKKHWNINIDISTSFQCWKKNIDIVLKYQRWYFNIIILDVEMDVENTLKNQMLNRH